MVRSLMLAPALFTRMSMRLCAASTFLTSSATSSGLVRSAACQLTRHMRDKVLILRVHPNDAVPCRDDVHGREQGPIIELR